MQFFLLLPFSFLKGNFICVYVITEKKIQEDNLERFSYDLEMKAREQNRNDKRTEIERFDWFIERTDKRAWLFIG